MTHKQLDSLFDSYHFQLMCSFSISAEGQAICHETAERIREQIMKGKRWNLDQFCDAYDLWKGEHPYSTNW